MSVFAVAGVGVGSLVIVKDRIEITVQDGNRGDAPDPLALVRDDLQQLHADLEAISKAFGGNMEELARVLGDQAETQVRLQSSLADVVAAVRRTDTRHLTASLAKLQREMSSLREAVLHRAAPVDSPPKPEVVAKPVPPTPEPAKKIPVIDQPKKPVKTPARKPAFLSFTLPSRGFEFGKPQHYRILPSLSRVGFDAKSTLHDFSGVTSKIRGDVYANFVTVKPAWKGEVSCDAATLRTGVDGRDEALREHLNTKENSRIKFEITGFTANSGGVDAAKRTVSGVITGQMHIRTKTRAFEMPIKISVDQSQRVLIEGQTTLKMSDYGVPVPSKLGVISTEDEVKVWISLRARSVGPWDGAK